VSFGLPWLLFVILVFLHACKKKTLRGFAIFRLYRKNAAGSVATRLGVESKQTIHRRVPASSRCPD